MPQITVGRTTLAILLARAATLTHTYFRAHHIRFQTHIRPCSCVWHQKPLSQPSSSPSPSPEHGLTIKALINMSLSLLRTPTRSTAPSGPLRAVPDLHNCRSHQIERPVVIPDDGNGILDVLNSLIEPFNTLLFFFDLVLLVVWERFWVNRSWGALRKRTSTIVGSCCSRMQSFGAREWDVPRCDNSLGWPSWEYSM